MVHSIVNFNCHSLQWYHCLFIFLYRPFKAANAWRNISNLIYFQLLLCVRVGDCFYTLSLFVRAGFFLTLFFLCFFVILIFFLLFLSVALSFSDTVLHTLFCLLFVGAFLFRICFRESCNLQAGVWINIDEIHMGKFNNVGSCKLQVSLIVYSFICCHLFCLCVYIWSNYVVSGRERYFVKNCRTTCERGKNWICGRQRSLSTANIPLHNSAPVKMPTI